MCIGWMKKSHLSCVEKDFPWSFFHLPLGHLISSSIAGCPKITFHISMSSEDFVDYNVGYTDKVYNWQYNVYVVMTILSLSPRHVWCTVQEPDVTMNVCFVCGRIVCGIMCGRRVAPVCVGNIDQQPTHKIELRKLKRIAVKLKRHLLGETLEVLLTFKLSTVDSTS